MGAIRVTRNIYITSIGDHMSYKNEMRIVIAVAVATIILVILTVVFAIQALATNINVTITHPSLELDDTATGVTINPQETKHGKLLQGSEL